MLGIRVRSGVPRCLVSGKDAHIDALVEDGLLDPEAVTGDAAALVLTRRGRLLADRVVRTLAS